MSFYAIDYSFITNLLNVPTKRKKVFAALLAVLTKPLQWRNNLFVEYIEGSTYGAWNHLTGYPAGSRVIFTDNAVYETPNGAAGNSQSPLNPVYWTKVNDCFIGVNERIKYSSQIIMFEYALNRWFQNPQPNPQIYIANNTTSTQFLMGHTSQYSSKMAGLSGYQGDYMGNVYTVLQYDYTIFFPSALFADLPPASSPDKEKVIRNFADKYNLAGMNYQITTY